MYYILDFLISLDTYLVHRFKKPDTSELSNIVEFDLSLFESNRRYVVFRTILKDFVPASLMISD